MPVVPQGSLILVTGASGFIATHAVNELLQRGFLVRGTVRSQEKGEYLKKLFSHAGDRFQYVIVEDLQKEGGFNEAVKGVEGILHLASPLARTAPSGVWENIIEPAKAGTSSVLYTALKHNPDVKRIVITSSFVAIADLTSEPGTIFTEKDWNTTATDKALRLGDNLKPFEAYSASKVWAEKVAWDFLEKEKPNFDIATILPPLVAGPVIHQATTPKATNRTNAGLWACLTGVLDPNASAEESLNIPLVDVRDVAAVHVEALVHPEASNIRIGVSEGNHSYQEILDVVREEDPELASKFPNANWGVPGAKPSSLPLGQDGSLPERLFGFKYHTFKETALDIVRDLWEKSVEFGWDLTGKQA